MVNRIPGSPAKLRTVPTKRKVHMGKGAQYFLHGLSNLSCFYCNCFALCEAFVLQILLWALEPGVWFHIWNLFWANYSYYHDNSNYLFKSWCSKSSSEKKPFLYDMTVFHVVFTTLFHDISKWMIGELTLDLLHGLYYVRRMMKSSLLS